MLKELSGQLNPKKIADLSSRLEHRDTRTALAAEAELSMLWAISRVAHMEPEPLLPNSTSRPEAASKDLFPSGSAVIEVRAVSDDSFSGKEAMDRTANIICAYADRLRKSAGSHLHFHFNERSYWDKRFHRERCVDPQFKLDNDSKEQLRKWIMAPGWPNPTSIRLLRDKTDVVITWRAWASPFFRTFCSMPAVAYDREDNPIYKALKSKSGQLKGVADGTLRCIVLVDAGCSLLRWMRPRGMTAVHEIGGDTIIRHSLRKLSIDVVIVLSPYRSNTGLLPQLSQLLWNVTCFDGRKVVPKGEYEGIERMAKQLPRPQFEGSQARDIHKQGGFEPDEKWYLPASITSQRGGKMTIKLSAALLHEYLAGRIDEGRFRQEAFNKEQNLFATELTRGNSIRHVQFEPGGIDEDDDYIIFELDLDWNQVIRRIPS